MKMFDCKFILVLGFMGFCSFQCLKLIPERVQVHYFDKDYLQNCTMNVRRAARGGDYVVNFYFTVMQYLGNNVTLSIYVYEFLNNEYKPSFIQLHYRLCDMILKDQLAGTIPRKSGLETCPLIPGPYTLKNMSFNQEIPSVWPLEKGMLRVVVKHDAKPNGIIAKGDVMLTFANIVPVKRKQTKAPVVAGAGSV